MDEDEYHRRLTVLAKTLAKCLGPLGTDREGEPWTRGLPLAP
ncbi:hypothetical protein ACFZA1_27840 [Streptomyces filipinensis]